MNQNQKPKTGKIVAGATLIVVAVLFILHFLGINLPNFGSVSGFRLLLGLILLGWIVKSLSRLHFAETFLPLSLEAFVFKHQLAAIPSLSGLASVGFWGFALCGLLLYAGFSLLLPRHRHGLRETEAAGEHGKSPLHSHESNFGHSSIYVDCSEPIFDRIDNSFGSCTVHFSCPEALAADGFLEIDNTFGTVTLLVPKGWRVVDRIEPSLGSVILPAAVNSIGPTLTLTGETSLGSVTVRYV